MIFRSGHFFLTCLLTNAPAVFQSFMNKIFCDLLNQRHSMWCNVCNVLHCLLQHHLFVKAEKCEFHCSIVLILGTWVPFHVISLHSVEMNQVKVKAIMVWPRLTTIKEIQRFLGFVTFYQCFISDYSTAATPFTTLSWSKSKTLCLSELAQKAFEDLKGRFTTAFILRHPDPDLPFIVEVDTKCGIGTVFFQPHCMPAKLYPCAYFSWKLALANPTMMYWTKNFYQNNPRGKEALARGSILSLPSNYRP